MKRSFYLLFSIAAVSIFCISSLSFADSKEKDKPKQNAAANAPKITKQEAEQVVRFAYHGCTIDSCTMVNGKDHPNWAVSAVIPGGSTATQIQVDGVTGKIIP
jgi:hypothetical protein